MPKKVDYPISFEDVTGRKWLRARVGKSTLEEIQKHEIALQEQYDAEEARIDALPEEERKTAPRKYQLIEVRLTAIKDYCAFEDGTPVDFDVLDMGEGQHLYTGFWRSIWGLDPLGNLR